MKYLIILLTFSLVAITGCDKDQTLIYNQSDFQQVDIRSHDKPFKGVGYAVDAPPPGILTCDAPVFERSVIGGGNATHIGKYEATIIECFNPVTLTGVGFAILTASNGDILHMDYEVQYQLLPDDPPNIVHGVFNYWQFDGDQCTGRFEGMTGSGTGTLEGDLAAGYYEWDVTGIVNY